MPRSVIGEQRGTMGNNREQKKKKEEKEKEKRKKQRKKKKKKNKEKENGKAASPPPLTLPSRTSSTLRAQRQLRHKLFLRQGMPLLPGAIW